MRITFVVPTLNISGGLRVVSIYAELLHKKGHIVTVVTPKQKKPTFKQCVKHFLKWKGYQFDNKFNSTFFNRSSYSVIVTNSSDLVVSNDVPNADIVIATWWETLEWVNDFCDSKGKRVYFVQGLETLNVFQPKGRVEATYQNLVPKITIAKWLVSELNARSASNIYLVPNSVDLGVFHTKKRCKQNVPTIGFLFSETGSKGVEVALSVIHRLKTNNPNLRVLCFGTQNPDLIILPQYIEFIFNPAQTEIKKIYSQCDVWLCCSTMEGFGLTVLEAMACRTPVITTKCGGPEELVTEGVNGYLCKVNDVESLAIATQKLLNSNYISWQRFSDAAYENATSYSWNDAVNLFEQSLLAIFKD